MYKTKTPECIKTSLKTCLCACLNRTEKNFNTDAIINISAATFQPRMINPNHFSTEITVIITSTFWSLWNVIDLWTSTPKSFLSHHTLYNLKPHKTSLWHHKLAHHMNIDSFFKLAGKTRREWKNMNTTIKEISRSVLRDRIHEKNTLIH